MNKLPFTFIISILIHTVLLYSFSKHESMKNNTALSSAYTSIEIYTIHTANRGSQTSKDNVGSDKVSSKRTKNEKVEKKEKSDTGKKKQHEINRQNINKSAKAGMEGYNKNANFTQGYASYIPSPSYPLSSRRNKEEGTVIFRINIDKNGKLINYKIIKSSGYKKLDKQAEKSVKNSKFKPAIENGNKVDSIFELKITFTLKDK